jgi:NADPH:quinone reductase-like Zn-dependent oxidoreductase
MRAVVQDRYGPPEVLRIAEIDRPAPGDGDVLIRVRATTVSQSDTHARAASPFIWRLFAGFRRPRWRTLGVELAGEVAAVGEAVKDFRVGEEVFGMPSTYFGTYAEYVCVPETGPIAHKPAGFTFEEAAAVCDGAMQALSALRLADAKEGRRIVIYGASGSLGTAAVRLPGTSVPTSRLSLAGASWSRRWPCWWRPGGWEASGCGARSVVGASRTSCS